MSSSSCGNFCKHEFRRYHFSLDYVSPYDFVSFQCGCHKLYKYWRIFWALYHFIWIMLTGIFSYQWAGYESAQKIKWFIYLTDWAFLILTLSTIIDASCVVFINVKRDDIIQDISPTMPTYLKINWVIFNVSNTISVLMSVMYWSLIYTSEEDMTAVNIETHALNVVYVIINLFLTRIPVRFYHFFHPMIFGVIYVLFSVIYQISGGMNHKNKPYIYSMLDWTKSTHTTMVSLIVVLIAIPLCHVTIFLFHLLRIYLYKKCCFWNKRSCAIITPQQNSYKQENCLETKKGDDIEIQLRKNSIYSDKPSSNLSSNESTTLCVDSSEKNAEEKVSETNNHDAKTDG